MHIAACVIVTALVFAPAERLALVSRARALAPASRAGEVVVARARRP